MKDSKMKASSVIVFEPLPGYTEAYTVKYIDNSGEYSKLKTITVFTKTKDAHAAVDKAVTIALNLEKGAVCSVMYK